MIDQAIGRIRVRVDTRQAARQEASGRRRGTSEIEYTPRRI